MAPRRTDPAEGTGATPPDTGDPDGGSERVVRRAPFSSNPEVGARGQRTQQRILEAALQLFGEEGYHRCSIDRITARAGCSRASFYQYFSGKEAVFQQLTGQVARQLRASTEALDLLTPDEAGWVALRAWLARHAEIYRRYEPAFHEYPAAAQTDETVATGSARWQERNIARFHARIVTTTLPPRQLDPVITLLQETVNRTLGMAGILRSATPGDHPEDRVIDALADVLHRSLFGLDAEVNVHPPSSRRPRALPFDAVVRDALRRDEPAEDVRDGAQQTLLALMKGGRDVFVQLGYHRVRVDDVVEAAGVSHGAFYRYFENKDQLARVLTTQAMRSVSVVLEEIPTEAGLRRRIGPDRLAPVAPSLQPDAVRRGRDAPGVGGRVVAGRRDPGVLGAGVGLGPADDGRLPAAPRVRRRGHRGARAAGPAERVRHAATTTGRRRRDRPHRPAGLPGPLTTPARPR